MMENIWIKEDDKKELKELDKKVDYKFIWLPDIINSNTWYVTNTEAYIQIPKQ